MTTRDDAAPPQERPALAALASLAFGHARATGTSAGTTRHLAFLSIEALELDLSDPEQRDFGDYELLERLGAGGMGVVYRARQKSLDRDVAIKLLSAGPWASRDFVARFQREAQSAARLQHPNIVPIHEIGSRDELNYFSMALVRGPTLAQSLTENGAMPARQAARLVRTIAEALHYAHRLGVLHLDLKPGNVLTDEHGEPHVADFGLARRIDSSLATDTDEISGTPSYMAPEQIELRRHKLSVATDIYGLGAILYELVSGHPPFDAATPRETLELVLAGRLRSPRRYRSDIPEDLQAICLKCLAKEPSERYASAQVLADDLGRFIEGRAVLARPLNLPQRMLRWARREPKLAIASGLGLVALVAGLAASTWQWQRAEDSAAAARQQTWYTRGEAAWRLADEGRGVDAMPLLVDNLHEREAHGDSAGATLERLRLSTLHTGGAQLIDAIATGVAGRAVDVDRVGERVAVADLDEGLRLIAVEDGRTLWHAETRAAAGFRATGMPLTRVDFSPDGRYLITATMEPPTFLRPHGRNNVLVDAADGRVVLPPLERFPDFLDATYSADGRYAVLRNKVGDAQFFQVDGWRPLTPKRRTPSLAGSWRVGDGGRYIARSLNHRIELLDTRSLESIYAHQFDQARGIKLWATQPGGGLLALGHHDGTVRLLDSTGLTLRELTPAPFDAADMLSFSEDGRWLVAGSGGRVFLWDVASGSGGTLTAGRPIDATRIQADAASGTVFAFGPTHAVLWRLPELTDGTGDLGKRISGARLLVSQFAFGNSLPRNAAAYAPAANLAVNIERNGELRLWRWRDSRPLGARGSAQTIDELHFDGHHVVVVDGHTVRVLEIESERGVSPAMEHPQPVSLASFTPDGRTLVTTSGRELRAFDWRSGRLRFPPIALDNSPLRVAISPDSSTLLTTTGGYREDRFVEFASTFDLESGSAHARDVPFPGPLNGLRFSRNGRFLTHWRYGVAEVRDANSLRTRGQPLRFGADIVAARRTASAMQTSAEALAQETPIIDAAVSAEGSRLTLILAGWEPEKPRLLEVDAGSRRTLRSHRLNAGHIWRLWPHGNAYDFTIWNEIAETVHWFDSKGGNRALPHARGGPQSAQAASHDGRWFASASTGGVLLADRDSGEWATTALTAQLPLGDAIAQLAFAPDGSRLLARSQRGRWVWWPLSPEARSATQLAEQLARLRPPIVADGAPIATALPEPEREALRANDPGAPRPAIASPVASALPAAPGPAAPGYAFVDLRPAINRPIDAVDLLGIGDLSDLLAVPVGPQRWLGVDFDVRGVVALRMREAPQAPVGFPVASVPVPPPQPRFAALHLLLSGCCPLPGHAEVPYGYLDLRYTDGSHARIAFVHQHHMWHIGDDPGDARAARIAWVVATQHWFSLRLYAARLANPHPEREVASIGFEASETFASGPLIFAATAELAPGGAAEPAASGQPP